MIPPFCQECGNRDVNAFRRMADNSGNVVIECLLCVRAAKPGLAVEVFDGPLIRPLKNGNPPGIVKDGG